MFNLKVCSVLSTTILFLVCISASVVSNAQSEPDIKPIVSTIAVAQVRVTATPVRVQLPTQSAPATEILLATATPTLTPTEVGPLLIEVPADTSEINVRSEPDPDSERLGVVRATERYVVTGRYFSWLRIEYEASPNGVGWIFGQLVTILGDGAQIPDVDPYNTTQPSIDSLGAITPDPDNPELALLTPTEDTRQIVVPTNESGVAEALPLGDDRLPTFTPPAENFSVDATVAPDTTVTITDEGSESEIETSLTNIINNGLPPIVPILLLGVFGLLGIIVVVIRS